MVFSSITFLIYFLPVFLWVYLATKASWKNSVALLFSILFYAWGAPKFVFILMGSTIIDFYLVRHMHLQKTKKQKQYFLTLSILLNVGLLVYFKYANFFVENVNHLFLKNNIEPWTWTAVALPIGISFYTFQTLTYSIDIYRGKDKPLDKLRDYLLYIMLFPQMIAGPIVRFSTIAGQLRKRSINSIDLLQGFFRFSLGLSKKVLLANPMGALADEIINGNIANLSAPHAWLGILAYAFQIYFDFSGYSDMAIGLGRMMGFHFPENFNNPYVSKSITEFWRRWHITLGTWMRDYLYIPLGGNRKSILRNYFNLWVVFLISGLWHGAAWNFVAWGAFHGLFLVLDKLFLLGLTKRMPAFITITFTFIISLLGWVIFRIENFGQALVYYRQMFSGELSFEAINLSGYQITVLCASAIFSFITLSKIGGKLEKIAFFETGVLKLNTIKFALTLAFLVLSVSWLTTSSFNPFIYFRF